MTDKKQSAHSRRLDRENKELIDISIATVTTDLTQYISQVETSVTDLSSVVTSHENILNPLPYVGNFNSTCSSLSINLDGIRSALGGTFVTDPNLNYGEQPPANYGELGYWTTYTFTCSSINPNDLTWSIGDIIRLKHSGGCIVDAQLQQYTKSTGEYVVRIYYPLPDNCNGTQVGWELSNPKAANETRVFCCVQDLDGGWCPIGEAPDLSTLWENVIIGGTSTDQLNIPIISGGFS